MEHGQRTLPKASKPLNDPNMLIAIVETRLYWACGCSAERVYATVAVGSNCETET